METSSSSGRCRQRRADLFPTKPNQPEDDMSQISVRKGFAARPYVRNESFSAHEMIYTRLAAPDTLPSLSLWMDEIMQRRSELDRNSVAPSPYKAPSRVTLNEAKLSNYVKDLADPNVPLMRLSRNVPTAFVERSSLRCCGRVVPFLRLPTRPMLPTLHLAMLLQPCRRPPASQLLQQRHLARASTSHALSGSFALSVQQSSLPSATSQQLPSCPRSLSTSAHGWPSRLLNSILYRRLKARQLLLHPRSGLAFYLPSQDTRWFFLVSFSHGRCGALCSHPFQSQSSLLAISSSS